MIFDKDESENIDFTKYDFLITATPKKVSGDVFEIHTVIEKFQRMDWNNARMLTEPYIYVLEKKR
jgi:hypothetical protein